MEENVRVPPLRGFERDVLPWLDSVYRLARVLGAEEALAEDVVAATFLGAFAEWSARAAPDATDPKAHWHDRLLAICVRECRDRMPMVWSDAGPADPDASRDPVTPNSDALHVARVYATGLALGLDDLWTRSEAAGGLLPALASIPLAERLAVALVDLERVPVYRAAAITRTGAGALRVRVLRGRGLLQEALLDAVHGARLVPPPATAIMPVPAATSTQHP